MGSALGSPSFSKIISYLPNFAGISRHTKAKVLSDFDKDWKGWREAKEEGRLMRNEWRFWRFEVSGALAMLLAHAHCEVVLAYSASNSLRGCHNPAASQQSQWGTNLVRNLTQHYGRRSLR